LGASKPRTPGGLPLRRNLAQHSVRSASDPGREGNAGRRRQRAPLQGLGNLGALGRPPPRRANPHRTSTSGPIARLPARPSTATWPITLPVCRPTVWRP